MMSRLDYLVGLIIRITSTDWVGDMTRLFLNENTHCLYIICFNISPPQDITV